MVTQSEAFQAISDRRLVVSLLLCWKRKEAMKPNKDTEVSWLVEAFPSGRPLVSISHCFVFSALLRCNYLSHPCHIQGNTLRGFDILTATEDGHNLQRHSTQAGRQAGGNSKCKTVSWTTAVSKVSNQGQAIRGRGGSKTQPVFLCCSLQKLLRLPNIVHSLRLFTKLCQIQRGRCWMDSWFWSAPWHYKCGGGGDHAGIPPLKTSKTLHFWPTPSQLFTQDHVLSC